MSTLGTKWERFFHIGTRQRRKMEILGGSRCQNIYLFYGQICRNSKSFHPLAESHVNQQCLQSMSMRMLNERVGLQYLLYGPSKIISDNLRILRFQKA